LRPLTLQGRTSKIDPIEIPAACENMDWILRLGIRSSGASAEYGNKPSSS
jgi:hypothetical protein